MKIPLTGSKDKKTENKGAKDTAGVTVVVTGSDNKKKKT